MSTEFVVALVIVTVTTLLIVAGLVYYIVRALKQRVAIAPGWSFDRDQQPLLFWLQIGAVAWFALLTAAKFLLAIMRLLHLS